jgi:hypothetical protein
MADTPERSIEKEVAAIQAAGVIVAAYVGNLVPPTKNDFGEDDIAQYTAKVKQALLDGTAKRAKFPGEK